MTAGKQAAYTAVSQETVQEMHQKFQKGLEAKARKALPQDAVDPEGLVDSLKALLIEATRKGMTFKAEELSELAAQGVEAVDLKREKVEASLHVRDPKWSRYRSPRLSARQERQIAEAAAERHDDALVERVFAGKDRIYLHLNGATDVTETQKNIASWLETKGYSITDYNKGYATDAAGKQQFKIGKLLKDEEALYKSFTEDSSRGLDNLLVVLSRNPMDIARMSTGHPWASCMGSGGINWRFVPRDVKKGSMIAYLVSEKDPDIVSPLARILIKPFSEEKSGLAGIAERFFGGVKAERKAKPRQIFVSYASFGLHNQAFKTAVNDFLEANFNRGITGEFWLVSGLYRDLKKRHVVKRASVPVLL